MANEISINTSLTWRKNGQALSGSVSETYDQVGNGAFAQVQTIGATTEPLDLGDVTGTKYLLVKNMTTKGATPVIWIDTTTPVVPGATSAQKVIPSQATFQVTSNDTWYAICTSGTQDLSVVAIEV